MPDREKVIKDNAIRGLQSAIEISGALVHLRKEHAKAILALLKGQEAEINKISNAYLDLVGKASKQPDYMPKKGSWIRHGEPPEYVIECSRCGQKYFCHAMQTLANYCSMCGARMESWIVEGNEV